MKKTFTLFCTVLGISAGALLTGCCCGKSTVALTDGGWELELESLDGASRNWQEPEQDITLIIAPDGKFSGCAGINRYFGKAELNSTAGTLKFGTAGATMMAGPGGEYERAYLKMLSTVDSYVICGDDLYLKSKGKTVAEFDHESLADLND